MWSHGGEAALGRYAPEAASAYTELIIALPAGVDPRILGEAAIEEFADQFRTDVAGITGDQRAAFVAATGAQLFPVIQIVWLADVAPRLRAALDALFDSSEWAECRTDVVPDAWPLVEGFMQAVARLDALDPVLTELIRLRGAVQHDCRVCRSRRSADAIDQGADETTFAAVDDHSTSDLPEPTRAALALVDAIIWTPTAIPPEVVDAVRAHLSPAQTVEVVLDVIRNAANKIAVALRADAPEVTDGVQLFTTAPDGTLTTLPSTHLQPMVARAVIVSYGDVQPIVAGGLGHGVRKHRARDPGRGIARRGLRRRQQPRAHSGVVGCRLGLRRSSRGSGELVWGDETTPRAHVTPFTVVEADRPRRFAFRWIVDQAKADKSLLVTFELVPAGEGTLLRLTETGFREMGWEAAVLEAQYQEHVQGWDLHLGHLRDYLTKLVSR